MASDIIDDARKSIEDADSFTEWIRDTMIGGPILALATAIVGAIMAIGDLFLAPFEALASGFGRIIDNIFLSATDIVGAGAETASRSILDGLTAWAGPLAFPLAVGVVLLTIYMVVSAIRYISPVDMIRNSLR